MRNHLLDKSDIKNIIQFVDPIHTLLKRNSGLYKLWYYGREILPGHPNHDYMIGTQPGLSFSILYEKSRICETVQPVSRI